MVWSSLSIGGRCSPTRPGPPERWVGRRCRLGEDQGRAGRADRAGDVEIVAAGQLKELRTARLSHRAWIPPGPCRSRSVVPQGWMSRPTGADGSRVRPPDPLLPPLLRQRVRRCSWGSRRRLRGAAYCGLLRRNHQHASLGGPPSTAAIEPRGGCLGKQHGVSCLQALRGSGGASSGIFTRITRPGTGLPGGSCPPTQWGRPPPNGARPPRCGAACGCGRPSETRITATGRPPGLGPTAVPHRAGEGAVPRRGRWKGAGHGRITQPGPCSRSVDGSVWSGKRKRRSCEPGGMTMSRWHREYGAVDASG